MTALADTSALVAVLDPDDRHHDACAEAFERLAGSGELLTHNYVVVEALAVIGRRYLLGSRGRFISEVLPSIPVAFIEEPTHSRGMETFLATERRRSSIVDQVSFAFMRERGITRAFTLDRDFARAGFEIVPA